MLTKPAKVQSPDRHLNQVQDNFGKAIDQIQQTPTLGGVLLESVALVAGSNTINHKLGRNLKGWIITRLRGSAAPILTDWQSYSMTIGGTTTAPTKGTTAVDSAKWRRNGDSMEVAYQYRHTTAGSAGSGNYLFPLPPGFTIDTAKFPTDANSSPDTTVGTAAAYEGTVVGMGYVFMWDSTNLAARVLTNTTQNFLSSSFYALSNNPIQISLNARVPISGWSTLTSGYPQIADTQDSNLTPDLTLSLVVSSATTVDLYVF